MDVSANAKGGGDGADMATGISVVDGSSGGKGTLVYNGNGSSTYTPAAGEDGKVSFEYTITDADGDSATATVTITLQDDSKPEVDITYGDPSSDDAVGVVWESALPEGSGGGSTTTGGQLVADTGNEDRKSVV